MLHQFLIIALDISNPECYTSIFIADQPHTLLDVLVPSRRPGRPPGTAIKATPDRRAGNSDFAAQTQRRRVLILGELLRMTGQARQDPVQVGVASGFRKGGKRKNKPNRVNMRIINNIPYN